MSMHDHQKHYRPIYLVPAVEEALARRAADEGIDRQMLIRRYVREGLYRPRSASLRTADLPGAAEPLRSSGGFYLEGALIAPLTARAAALNLSEAQLIRCFITEGLNAPPKEQAVTRIQELAVLRSGRDAYLRRAEQVVAPYLEAAERIRLQAAAELTALRACCKHERIIELRGAVAVYSCPCSDIEHLRHSTQAGLCVDCGLFEGICRDTYPRYRRLAPKVTKDVGYEEFARLRAEFLTFINDR